MCLSGSPVLPGLRTDDLGEEAGHKDNLAAVMESMGIYDTDLRTRGNDGSTAAGETQRLLRILLSTLKKAVSQGPLSAQSNQPSAASELESEADPKPPKELLSQTNYSQVRRSPAETRWTSPTRLFSFRRTWTAAPGVLPAQAPPSTSSPPQKSRRPGLQVSTKDSAAAAHQPTFAVPVHAVAVCRCRGGSAFPRAPAKAGA